MPTLNEILAAKAAKTTPSAPVLTAKDDAVEIPAALPPPAYQPVTGRLAGFTTLGDQIPLEWPETWDGKEWKEARHSLSDKIGVLVDAEGAGWIVLFRQESFPIFLHGPLLAIVAPF